jgi:hypothetical protein
MMKVAYNNCFGGFSLSKDAYDHMGIEWDGYGFAFSRDDKRTDPRLIECIETLGDKANGQCACLRIEEIPDGAEFEITEYDGNESVEPPRMSW